MLSRHSKITEYRMSDVSFWNLFRENFSPLVLRIIKSDRKQVYAKNMLEISHFSYGGFKQHNSLPRIFTGTIRGKQEGREIVGSGRSFRSYPEALRKSFYEYLERKCVNFSQVKNKISTAEQSDFALENQLLQNMLTEMSKKSIKILKKIKAYNLSKQAYEFLPAQLFFPCKSQGEGGQYLELNTNGNAAGPTKLSAVASALLELLERDHLMLFWLAKKSGVKVVECELDLSLRPIFNKFINRGMKIRAYMLKHDFNIPVFVVVVLDDRVPLELKASFGSSAGVLSAKAIEKAATECLYSFEAISKEGPLSQQEKESIGSLTYKNRGRYFTGADATLLWEAFEGGEQVCLSELRKTYRDFEIGSSDEIEYVIKEFIDKGSDFTPYCAFFDTPAFIRNIFVVKVFVFGLLPFYLFEKNKMDQISVHSRLSDFCGLASGEDLESVIRKEPIPLA